MDPITATVMTVASLGMSAGSSIMKGAGTKAANEYQAAKLERAAQYGRVQADQTFGQLTEKLNMTLGNIDAIRSAANTDPTSPTGAAVRDYQEKVGERERSIRVDNILAQTQQNESDAAYLREAGNYALMQGRLGAGIGIAKGLGQGAGRMPT